MKLSLLDKLHMRHRFASYRYKSEVPDIRYVMESNLENKTLVDIGANKGIYSYYLSRKAGPQGKVYAFEAQLELGDHLQSVEENFNLNNLYIINKGLSSEPGILKMARSKVGSGGASFHFSADSQLEELDVPVTTLDNFFGKDAQETIEFIKVDVQDHEYQVLKGGEMVLTRDNPTILLECTDKEARAGELFGYLADLGYSGFFISFVLRIMPDTATRIEAVTFDIPNFISTIMCDLRWIFEIIFLLRIRKKYTGCQNIGVTEHLPN